MYPQAGQDRAAPKNLEAPIFIDGFKRVNQRIHSCHEAATRIENVIDRLLSPTPRPAGAGAPVAAPQTIEAMLNDVDNSVDGLAARLSELAARLERAA